MPRDKGDIISALTRKGFQRGKGNHKYLIYHHIDGKKSIVKTMVSHGSGGQTIGDGLLSQMARQVRLEKESFLELVDCTLDQIGYESQAFPQVAAVPAPKQPLSAKTIRR